ncbi:tetratricopeptide repeat protein [Marinigracilibium pacificum]|uniref:Tetratricopeptide repeat protein n=1 Tax=Marinigracilibium pacificum TaxID=2729599 RepID=A0A848J2H7_9BACT|nr:tetratricopeptide repeat protein [Marinigracilibium pacificum]NMM48684.1 tetratricopeptide repeat protein [Marinigracilibium pacificum]
MESFCKNFNNALKITFVLILLIHFSAIPAIAEKIDKDSVYNELKRSFKSDSHEDFIENCINAINAETISFKDMGKVKYMMAQSYNIKGDLINCVQSLFSASDIFIELNDKEKLALTYNFLGEVYRKGGEYVAAIDYFIESLTYFKEQNKYDNVAMVCYNLGLTYYNIDDYEDAKKYFFEALDNNEKVNDIDRSSRIYNLLGAIHFKLADYEVARSYYLLSMEIYKDKVPEERLGIAYSNLAEIHLVQGNYQKAISESRKALIYKEEPYPNSQSYDLPDAMITLAKALLETGKIKESINILENGILERDQAGFHQNYFRAIDLYFSISDSLQLQSSNSNRIAKILVDQTKLLKEQNSLLNNSKSQYLIRLADSDYRYESALSGIKTNKKINYWGYLIFICLVSFAVSVHFYRRRKRKEKLKKSLKDLLN